MTGGRTDEIAIHIHISCCA